MTKGRYHSLYCIKSQKDKLLYQYVDLQRAKSASISASKTGFATEEVTIQKYPTEIGKILERSMTNYKFHINTIDLTRAVIRYSPESIIDWILMELPNLSKLSLFELQYVSITRIFS